MEAVDVEQRRKVRLFAAQPNAVEERRSGLADFTKGTISGDELVQYVCDKLDEKYGKGQLRGL